MVVVSGQLEDTGTPDDAMSSSDADDELIEPSTPTPSNATFSLHGKVHPLQVGTLPALRRPTAPTSANLAPHYICRARGQRYSPLADYQTTPRTRSHWLG